ncbi:NADP-dependent oxidoreductase [Paramicrobacterium fandaimingii]|uniref:NADP-dependent oxidoreductase n=1 Tax=Paramicrobacterium fandaimingii TaxID=2708079 RepID=UPI0014238FA5|nr:NADP-dependent oxidoreductase [Microbacterium fandaimingii]
MARRVQITDFGGPENFEVVDQQIPDAGLREFRVRVLAAGLNPVDAKIAADPANAERYGVTLPAGSGNDFAGRVDQVGARAIGFDVGQMVFGGARMLAQADYVVVGPDALTLIPDGLSVPKAASLDIAGRTAMAMVREMEISPADTVLVSAAAGGVGALTAQLCRLRGATVIGTASERNHELLRSRGILPVTYGDGLADRVRDAAPQGIDIVLDHSGRETLETAIALGVPANRVNTIADRPFAAEHGFSDYARAESTHDELRALAELVAEGTVDLPIEATYPLDHVREAYEHLLTGHVRGKIVLTLEG